MLLVKVDPLSGGCVRSRPQKRGARMNVPFGRDAVKATSSE